MIFIIINTYALQILNKTKNDLYGLASAIYINISNVCFGRIKIQNGILATDCIPLYRSTGTYFSRAI